MQAIRFPLAAALGFASSLAVAQATAPAPAPAKAPAAPATAVAPPAPAAGTSGGTVPGAPAGAKSGAKSAGQPRPDRAARGKGEPRGQLHSLYAAVMTDDERKAYSDKVRQVKTYEQCKTLLEDTLKTMEPRAKAQGKTFVATPTEACDKAKARGRLAG